MCPNLCPHFCAQCGKPLEMGVMMSDGPTVKKGDRILYCLPKPFGCGNVEIPEAKEEEDAETESGSR